MSILLADAFWGKLNEEAFKHDWIEYIAGVSIIVGLVFILALITFTKSWKWLWKEWFTSVDHKRIGIMYMVVSFVMLFKGLTDSAMMRAQQALSVGEMHGYLGPDHFQQIFTAHGTTMIFWVAMGVIFGLINLVMPLQIGARDVAFPYLNNISFWLFTAGGLYILSSLCIGHYAGTGWSSYPPLAGIKYNPGVGVDQWLWSLQLAGAGSLLSGINFFVTILKMRCPGMTLMRMPIFTWASLVTVVLVIFAFPILTATLTMLNTDRLLETHIFTSEFGGSPMLYVNLFWAWGHPEVYILVLPAFGIFSEVVPVFSRKKLFGYTSMVWALLAITFLSFIVWLHHFFTMGSGANVNAFFGIMTMIIAVPTGVKIFNWLFTLFRGKVKFSVSMHWFLGFVVVFTIGGMTGVMMAIPGIDFQVHNSLFLVAHFHNVIIGGVLFGFFAGYQYWFPKFFGFKLHEGLGKVAFWFWIIGFFFAFMPLYLMGFMGITRRLNHYEDTSLLPLLIIAAIGIGLIFVGVFFQVVQMLVSIKQRNENRDTTGDPWDGKTMEWSTSSPPPHYNFAFVPEVHGRDAFWLRKHSQQPEEKRPYESIHMPKNTGIGFYLGVFSFLFSWGLVWFMWWLVIVSAIAMIVCFITRLYKKEVDYYIPAEEVEQHEKRNKKA